MYCFITVKEIQWELTEKILLQEICVSWKQILEIKKAIFSVKKYLPIQSMT